MDQSYQHNLCLSKLSTDRGRTGRSRARAPRPRQMGRAKTMARNRNEARK